MGSIAELRPHQKEEFTSSLGMIVFLAAWAMMFAGLFFAYGFVRVRAGSWPPPGTPALPIALPAVNTIVISLSSMTAERALGSLRRGKLGPFKRELGVTILLGLVFLALQCQVWWTLVQAGMHLGTSLYSSVFYVLTAFHALHVAAGLVVLIYLLGGGLLGKYNQHKTIPVRVTTMFWHFVGVVWLLMFVTVYLV
jgi:cytochrome c oxidase subunit 3